MNIEGASEPRTMSAEPSGIVAFPGAGSFGAEFQQLLDECGPSAWLVRYPGRLGKNFGKAFGFQEFVESCLAQLGERKSDYPVLVGHSFGAYVAYMTAAELERRGAAVSVLVVLGATAPGQLSIPEWATVDRSGTASFLDEVATGTMTDECSSEWRDVVLDTAMHDLRSLRGFIASCHYKVRCPIIAACGEADPLTPISGIEEWAGFTDGECSCKVFPGGHSDMLFSLEFVSWLRLAIGMRDEG